jgi:methionyl-tRNA formyltransferase
MASSSPEKPLKVLFLGPETSPLLTFLREQGEEVTQTTERIDGEYCRAGGFEFLVSYGYRHILRRDVLDCFPGRAVNLHISLLPWNRGADPNFWSFVDGTPKGVTIHYLDEGVDTGDLIAQREVTFGPGETLKTTYERLQAEIQALFREQWPAIRAGTCARTPQQGEGTTHRVKDKEPLAHLLTEGHDTLVEALEAYGRGG